MALPARVLAPLTRRFQAVLLAIGEQSSPRLQRLWNQLPAYDEANIAAFARKAQPTLTAAKLASVRSAVGYYSLVAEVRPIGISPDDVDVTPDLREPFISTWNAFKHGESFDFAVAAGAARSAAVVRNLVTSSAMRTGDVVIERAELEIQGWQRIPDGKACAWCLSVAPGHYKSAESADFGHDRCGCTAAPILA